MSYYPTSGLGLIAGALKDDMPEAWPTMDGLIRRSIPGWIDYGWPYVEPKIEWAAPTILEQQWPNIDAKIRASVPSYVDSADPKIRSSIPSWLDAADEPLKLKIPQWIEAYTPYAVQQAWPAIQANINDMVAPTAAAVAPQITAQVIEAIRPQIPQMMSDQVVDIAISKAVQKTPAALLKSPIGIAAVAAGLLVTVAAAIQLKDKYWKR